MTQEQLIEFCEQQLNEVYIKAHQHNWSGRTLELAVARIESYYLGYAEAKGYKEIWSSTIH